MYGVAFFNSILLLFPLVIFPLLTPRAQLVKKNKRRAMIILFHVRSISYRYWNGPRSGQACWMSL